MTISNKYNAGFCVLKIKVVGYAHVIWITKKLVKNVSSINFRECMVVKSRSNDLNHCIHESIVEAGHRKRQIESGAANKV